MSTPKNADNLGKEIAMGNVIDLFGDDLKSCSYSEDDRGIGLSMRDQTLMVLPMGPDTYKVILGDEVILYDRKEIAEFLKVAAILVDSEDRWLPEFDLIGHNYK